MSPNRPAVLYEKVTVSEAGSALLRDMLFSPDQQYIYTLTDKQVSSALEMHPEKDAQTNTHALTNWAEVWKPNGSITSYTESDLWHCVV